MMTTYFVLYNKAFLTLIKKTGCHDTDSLFFLRIDLQASASRLIAFFVNYVSATKPEKDEGVGNYSFFTQSVVY